MTDALNTIKNEHRSLEQALLHYEAGGEREFVASVAALPAAGPSPPP